jgi:hypothetical protein
MDEIDRAKIGKKDEKLVGWDFIRKPKLPDSKLPPMQAKNALLTPNAIRVRQSSENSPTSHSNQGSGWIWFIVIVGVVGIIAAKLLGLW